MLKRIIVPMATAALLASCTFKNSRPTATTVGDLSPALACGESRVADVLLCASMMREASISHPVVLAVFLQNTGNKPVIFAASSNYFDFRLQVTDSNGTNVPLTSLGLKQSLGTLKRGTGTLFPQQTLFEQFNLAELFVLREGETYQLSISHGIDDLGAAGTFQKVSLSSIEFNVRKGE